MASYRQGLEGNSNPALIWPGLARVWKETEGQRGEGPPHNESGIERKSQADRSGGGYSVTNPVWLLRFPVTN